MFILLLLLGVILLAFVLAFRIYALLPSGKSPTSSNRRSTDTCSIAIFLGSGGHTSEMQTLISNLDFERYTPRTYIYCHGDEISLRAVGKLESDKGTSTKSDSYNLLPLPRARKVGQSPLSTSFSALRTILPTIHHLLILPLLRDPRNPFADVLVINGPGTCAVLVLVSWIRRILALPHTRIIYVESFARVRSLSLSAKLVRPFVDRFITQWPEAGGSNKAEYRGWLV
ncbi:hypothetical protein IAR55_003756 [Kwoniella newhampshirensis]|uniref:UDP-N-acetylglucosamine transferase subunit ALG14 n=1 Tax=Kwoniella newhampshirensis TaxID=1651941 RepID=A0AAW0YXM5_9TREE